MEQEIKRAFKLSDDDLEIVGGVIRNDLRSRTGNLQWLRVSSLRPSPALLLWQLLPSIYLSTSGGANNAAALHNVLKCSSRDLAGSLGALAQVSAADRRR